MNKQFADSGAWVKTFDEHFDSATLDLAKWNPRYISSAKSDDPDHGLANYFIRDSILHLRLTRDIPRPSQKGERVSSIETAEWLDREGRDIRVHFAQKYGWFEIRAKMPAGSGLHSAFWLLLAQPIDWDEAQKQGQVVEIDVFEQLGAKTSKHENDFNIHFTKDGHMKYDMGFDPSQAFHTYALEWHEGRMIWHIDSNAVWTYEGPTPQAEMFVLLGLYEGCGWTGPVDPEMDYPKDFEIDYLRVRELNGK